MIRRFTRIATGLAVGGALVFGALPATAAGSSYTLATVKQHKSSRDCWTVVNGKVYNLTKWISQHPGGQRVIKSMCGRDATAAFRRQHGLTGREATKLAAFRIGTLQKAAASTGPKLTAALVATHASRTDCWTIVNGKVYNVTAWIDDHPGGESMIVALCGIDGTAAFSGQHGLNGREAGTLARFLVGAVGANAPAA